MFDPNTRDDASREIDQFRADEVAQKPARPFEHREMASRCPSCRLRLHVRNYYVCRASGSRIVEESGAASCAYEPAEGEKG